MRLALFEPDIPQNVGAILRLCACLGLPLDVIEPCGFVFDDRRLKRVAMDYLDKVTLCRHDSWAAFLGAHEQAAQAGRLVLLSTRAETPYTAFAFREDDTLLLGRESKGVPETVHETADARVKIPLQSGLRSLNVALAAAMVAGEALRQTAGFQPGNGT
ncbi:MAG: tRNA (cytidine(34)-2'-O)-methyltransferase [Alphaproteobacteria bacterium]|nr:tRNA (cytidine(34)-2'-O)-methyltransferase [Alphaproteobacteria bacterium]